jgi:hypothetical protein
MIGILRLRKSMLAECQESAFRGVEPLVPFRTHASLYLILEIARLGTYLLPSQIRHCASYITFRPVPGVARWKPRKSWNYPYASHSRLAHTAVFNASRPRYPRGTLQDCHVTFDACVVQISTLAHTTKRCRAVARLQFPRWGSSPRDFDMVRERYLQCTQYRKHWAWSSCRRNWTYLLGKSVSYLDDLAHIVDAESVPRWQWGFGSNVAAARIRWLGLTLANLMLCYSVATMQMYTKLGHLLFGQPTFRPPN